MEKWTKKREIYQEYFKLYLPLRTSAIFLLTGVSFIPIAKFPSSLYWQVINACVESMAPVVSFVRTSVGPVTLRS